MPKIKYVPKRFNKATADIIISANKILDEYASQGFTLTLRQLYYQFVARDLLPNTQKSYKRLGSIIGDARLAGLIDWLHIEDRGRNLQKLQHFTDAKDALNKLASWYHVDMWENQRYRPEVWIEKDALTGVIQGVCEENDIPYFSCRGYTSLSEMWHTANRLRHWAELGYRPYIIHFGDHDPSGMDMSRDIQARLRTLHVLFSELKFSRVALNMEQVEEYNPPPNPAKITDSRYETYVSKYGDDSWELDALEPSVFRSIIESEVASIRDEAAWEVSRKEKAKVKKFLQQIPKQSGDLEDLLQSLGFTDKYHAKDYYEQEAWKRDKVSPGMIGADFLSLLNWIIKRII